MDKLQKLLKEVKELDEKATKGPWNICPSRSRKAFRMKEYIVNGCNWQFKFPYYITYACTESDSDGEIRFSATTKYFFITFWVIRLIHGKAKLECLSAKAYLEKELKRGVLRAPKV